MRDEIMTPKAVKEMEELFVLRKEALQILDLVITEWESDL